MDIAPGLTDVGIAGILVVAQNDKVSDIWHPPEEAIWCTGEKQFITRDQGMEDPNARVLTYAYSFL